MKDISRKLVLLRLIHNYTQAFLAEQLEVSSARYVVIEQDASRMTISRLEKLVAVYGLTLGDFFSFDEDSLMKVIHGQKEASSTQVGLSHKSLILKLQTMNKLLFQLLEETSVA